METKIQLSQEELTVIEKQLNGGVGFEFEEENDKVTMMGVLDKAEALLDELQAYDDIDGDLIAWYYNKYKEQNIAQ